MWTDGQGFLYQGDCRPGDREATPPQEIAAWEAAKAPSEQQQIDDFVRVQSAGQIQNELMLEGLMAALFGAAASQGVSEAQLEAGNVAYRMGKQLRQSIAAMRAAQQ